VSLCALAVIIFREKWGTVMRAGLVAAAAACFLCATSITVAAQSHNHAEHDAAKHIQEQAPLLEHIGNLHHPVKTKNQLAQRYFDQGLMMLYAFNHMESERSFRSAAAVDPHLAMAWWGVAMAVGPNLNDATSMEHDQKGRVAVSKALKLRKYASSPERGLIDAQAKRYGAKKEGDLPNLAEAYATAMGKLADKFKDDADIRTLYADAVMNTMPWDYYNADGTEKRNIGRAITILEGTMDRWPEHPGANHLYIHAVEASAHPERAIPAAERLGPFAPAAGHLVHMPSHIWVRVGDWADASKANEDASKADEDYIAQCHIQGRYPLGYYPHNLHMLTFASMMEGRSAVALQASKKAAGQMPKEMQEEPPSFAALFSSLPVFALVRFGRWDDLLAYPQPLDKKGLVQAMWKYGRTIAFARTGKIEDARKELAEMEKDIARPELATYKARHDNALDLLKVARELAAGEVETAAGQMDAGVEHFRKAVVAQDALFYSEPEDWYYPTRQSLGNALVKAGKNDEAEEVFREDIAKHPGNGWSLFGLQQSLRAQGKNEEADEVQQKFDKAWARADVKLTAAVF
jgi:tetratricopeptide (TPR) repeat protein